MSCKMTTWRRLPMRRAAGCLVAISVCLPAYAAAFGDAELGFRKAFQSLISSPHHVELDMQGMKIEGEAERGDCRIVTDQEVGAAVIDGDKVQGCLQRTEEALALYARAEGMGLETIDFKQTYERARERKKRLDMMLRMVREMEAPEVKPLGQQ